MGIGESRDVLMWCAIINFGTLLLWFLKVAVAGDWIYRYHSKWFPMPREDFNAAHYSGMMLFKLAILLFNVVPFVALLIVGS